MIRIDISFNELNTIDDELPDDLLYINCSNNELKELPKFN